MNCHSARLAALLTVCAALAAPGTVLAQSSGTLTGLIDASVGAGRAPSGTVSGDTGWSDSVQYSSPNWGGFNVVLTGAAGEGNGGRNTAATANYFGGPLGLTLSWQEAKKGAAVADTETWQLGGAYDLKVVKVFAQTGKVENETSGNEYKIHGLGASVPIGAGKLLAQYGMIKPQTGAERKTFTIGYDHYVSKRTDLYLVAMNDKVKSLSAGKSWSLGVRHRF